MDFRGFPTVRLRMGSPVFRTALPRGDCLGRRTVRRPRDFRGCRTARLRTGFRGFRTVRLRMGSLVFRTALPRGAFPGCLTAPPLTGSPGRVVGIPSSGNPGAAGGSWVAVVRAGRLPPGPGALFRGSGSSRRGRGRGPGRSTSTRSPTTPISSTPVPRGVLRALGAPAALRGCGRPRGLPEAPGCPSPRTPPTRAAPIPTAP